MVRFLRLALRLIACGAFHCAATIAAPSSQVPAIPEPWQPIKLPHIPRYDSWQIRNPVGTAMLSTFTLGRWPSRFGSDTQQIPDYMEKSWTWQGLAFVRAPAEKAFFSARKIIYLIEILIIWAAIKPHRVFKFMMRRSRE